jgi:hypothetical protein
MCICSNAPIHLLGIDFSIVCDACLGRNLMMEVQAPAAPATNIRRRRRASMSKGTGIRAQAGAK